MARSITNVILILAGCGTSAAPAPSPLSSRAQPITDPVQAAEAAIRDDMPIDYELPFADRSERREHRVRASVIACEAGHKPSCWKAMQMAPVGQRPGLAKQVEANCRAGDVLSCRALPSSPQARFPDLPGAAGRSEACENRDAACDRAAVRTECAAGFPTSCQALALLEPAERDSMALLARVEHLTAAGCDAWILAECAMSANDPTEQIRRAKKPCQLIGACNTVGMWAREAGNKIETRDAYERSCQYDESDEKRCLGLGAAYLDHELPEPVPGRGQALLDWVCRKFEKTLAPGESIVDMFAACKQMTPHH